MDSEGIKDCEQFHALHNSGLLGSLYDSLALKEKAASFYNKLHPVVKGRVKALKSLQCGTIKLEAQFHREISLVEKKYSTAQQNLFDQRKSIITGAHEPSIEQSNWLLDKNKEIDDHTGTFASSTNEGDGEAESCYDVKQPDKGIPGFWLTVLKQAPLICGLVRLSDINALRYLIDIRAIPFDNSVQSGFQLEFEFEPNEYFSNTTLTKKYYMSYEPKEDDPLNYDGPEVVASEGCEISWLPGKNLTKHTSTARKGNFGLDKHFLSKTINVDSFFNFFNPPKPTGSTKESHSILEQKILEDYDLGQYLKERVIPRAVTYFTGEALELDNEMDGVDDLLADDEYEEVSVQDANESDEA